MSETLTLGASPKPLDLELVEEGVRVEAPMAPGVFFTITPWSEYSPRFRRALELRQIRRALAEEQEKKDDVEGDDAALRAHQRQRDDPEFVADGVVANIEGLLNEKGNPVQYTRERAVQVLTPPEWRHLREWVANQALMLAVRLNKGVETEGKNSATGSSGKKAGAGRSKKTAA